MLILQGSRWAHKWQLCLCSPHSKRRALWPSRIHLAGEVASCPADREPCSPRRVRKCQRDMGCTSVCRGAGPLRGMAGAGGPACCPPQSLVGGKTPQCLLPPGLYCGILLIKVKLWDKKVGGEREWKPREWGGAASAEVKRSKHEGLWTCGHAKQLNTQKDVTRPTLFFCLLLWELCASPAAPLAQVHWEHSRRGTAAEQSSSSSLSPGYNVPGAKGCASNFRWAQKSTSQKKYASESNVWPVVLWSFSEYWILTIKNTWNVFNSNQTPPSPWKINLPQFCCFLEVINISDYVLNSCL